MKKWILIFLKRPILYTYLLSMMTTFVLFLSDKFFSYTEFSSIILVVLVAFFWIQPFLLSILNFVFLCSRNQEKLVLKAETKIENVTIIFGVLFNFLYLGSEGIGQIHFVDWEEQLYSAQLHSPIALNHMLTFFIIALLSIGGYFMIKWMPLKKMPPLVLAVSISALYLGNLLCILWIIQIFKLEAEIFILTLFPANCIIISIKTVKKLLWQWEEIQEMIEVNEKIRNNPLLFKLEQLLRKADYLPWIAVLLVIPILGIIIGILVLFGQQPDSIIRMWTETADWNLSHYIAPQNISIDEHYLCTVAAGGHKNIVKPIRLGRRHGGEVIVNRQLCIANAFEQILEERLPRFHKVVRYLYDHLGYPIARHIKSKYIADFLYYIMKPAEWIFLAVIYSCDSKPENRIATQYLAKK